MAIRKGIIILNGISVTDFAELVDSVEVNALDFTFRTKKLLFTTNGFASLLPGICVQPARAQVFVTAPIPNLELKGTFHLEEGFYYFRNIGNRILLGGGRNLDFEGEQTVEFGQTERIQRALEILLYETILPGRKIEITHRWSGIMGLGKQKTPIVQAISDKVFCGVRLGGMGIAIGNSVGKSLAALAVDQ